MTVPERLAASCRLTPERAAWLERLPDSVRRLEQRWRLQVGPPVDDESVRHGNDLFALASTLAP